MDGGAYAKFVDATLLTVKFQLPTTTSSTSESTSLRMLSGVDSLSYQEVGFVVTVGENSLTCSSSKVYTSVIAETGEGQQTVAPTDNFGTSAQYMSVHTLTGIKQFSTSFTVTPYWITLDGTTVQDTSRTETITSLL